MCTLSSLSTWTLIPLLVKTCSSHTSYWQVVLLHALCPVASNVTHRDSPWLITIIPQWVYLNPFFFYHFWSRRVHALFPVLDDVWDALSKQPILDIWQTSLVHVYIKYCPIWGPTVYTPRRDSVVNNDILAHTSYDQWITCSSYELSSVPFFTPNTLNYSFFCAGMCSFPVKGSKVPSIHTQPTNTSNILWNS